MTELLPDAATSGTPGFTNDGVTVENTGSSIGGQEEGRVVGKVGAPQTKKKAGPPPDPVAALRGWMETGETWDGEPLHLGEMAFMLKVMFRKYDAAVSQASVIAEEKPNVNGQPVDGDFVWDLTPHWKTRASAVVREHGDNPDALRHILTVDSSRGVQKAAQKRLDEIAA